MLTVDSVTAISVTHNSKHCVEALVESLASFSRIIIVDNGSSDGCPQKVSDMIPRAHLIQSQRNLGFGAANNLALDTVKTPYALLLNPDCIVSASEIEHLLSVATAYPDAAVIAPQLVRAGGLYEISYRWPTGTWRSTGPIASGACCVGFVSGAAMLLNMAVMREIGFFDERFFLYYEDEDLCQRVFSAKRQIIVAPEARFTHLSRGSVRGKHPLRAEFFRGYHHAQSKLIFEQKHHSPLSANKLRWRTLLLALLTLIPRILLPQPRYLARLFGRIIGLSQFQASQFQ
jgi:GT2 family glycosyltransferase